MIQGRNGLTTSECEHPLAPCHVEPGYANQFRQRLKLFCINSDGINATKLLPYFRFPQERRS
eukprot:snap_masked-scaffold_3-processed-gene-14.36-mRNA-1 protein AED:1.00 eAED:1.00 QI:0/-1/0/0/-1/1/1/0/61